MKRDKARRGYTFILGIMVLALLMLVSIAGAAPYAYITNQNYFLMNSTLKARSL
ncbi:hypothetical protein [Methanosarcina spelaei]|uniref:hypothetical protein n=1 Tax=Methanosarcina spelaei TaxID=1036679 RepID=UPI00148310A3|nr:hypothetical protein [Methanosarcina spelaei]